MTAINKTIHYCWFGGGELPPSAIKCIDSWKKYCPNYRIIRWDESNFDYLKCEYSREAYEKGMWAFVSDYARFVVIYEFGGLYFDTDVELIKSIDDIVDKGPFMGCQLRKGIEIAPGLGIGAPKGFELYKEIIDYYNKQHFINKDGSLNRITVVDRLTKLFKNYGFKGSGEVETVRGVNIYPPEYFCPMDIYTNEMVITDNTRSIHHFDASWLSEVDKAILFRTRKVEEKYGKVVAKIYRNSCCLGNEVKKRGFKGAYLYIKGKIFMKVHREELY